MGSISLKFDPSHLRFTGIIGTGGIGSGRFFALNGNETLGREESRSGHFLKIDDYCKQHIILHYIKVLLGRSFSVIPVGKLGDDAAGQTLYDEMMSTGFVMDLIEKVPQVSTLFSFCFYYPDGSGGNLTTDDSASSMVDRAIIEKAGTDIKKLGQKGIVMAAPEVPLLARQALLEAGKKNGLFCTASFTSGEIADATDSGIFSCVDLLAVNSGEASAIAGNIPAGADTETIVRAAIKKLQEFNRSMMISVTAGKQGSWCWDGQRLNHFPAISTKVVSTAGAGDAFFSGLITGLSLGLLFFESQQFGSLVAGLAVTSPHTIHKGIDRNSLRDFLKITGTSLSEKVIKLLEN
jgi:ribokinase